ncbi:hypothetical protein A5792_28500 [Mycolicibacterium peregrinum]|uniref:GmrSD restriction endonucleases N-terminal domain-containing protein n=1 Tax=Mycolicibacterium peregrinum TaxID=43304 RepID=A0A1A0QTU6_MYCPR|nr:DUF262 domain-containing protein [Mycolicibacterium peregrinum]OBB25333.1 hypothetical protein A5792_28500 [Mycolicibacterium peregrinum]
MPDAVDLDDDLPEDPAAQLQFDIAERLATLSDLADTPTEFDVSDGPFDAAEVDFASGAWMDRLAGVQGWLRLDKELPESADTFVAELVSAMGLDPAKALDSTGATPQLTIAGLSQLYERVDQAVRLQHVFAEAYNDNSGSRSAATKAWIEAWEDEPDTAESEPLQPVSAVADTWRIFEFIGKKLNLSPSYQRGDVWGTPARQLLIESILRGIPLPSVILLKPEDPTLPYEVVDGKQRLTAILRFVGKHPYAVARVKEADTHHKRAGELSKAFQDDYPKFKRMWKSLTHQSVTSKVEDEYYFPFKLRNSDKGLNGPLEAFQGKYFTQINDNEINVADERVIIKDLFEGTPEYRVPVILYKRADQKQIHEVFNLYNKQGMHLNAEEIRNAIFHELELTRATLAAAGDADLPTGVAPSLADVWAEVEHLGATLRSYGFGETRYRRTKVLAWVVATLLGDTGGEGLPSTARHIDDLLKRVQEDRSDPLRKDETVAALFEWIAGSAKIHAAYGDELWAPVFKDGASGQKWQELQLIGSLVGIALARAVDPNGIDERVEAAASAIFEESDTARKGEGESVWARPKKTQTRSQWVFIGQIAKAVADLLGVDVYAASAVIKTRFGSSGVESLLPR